MIQKAIIIDDDQLSTYLTQFVLEEQKLASRIECYFDAQEAFVELTTPAVADIPEVIFLDLNMPEMSGWAFLDALRPFENSLKKKTKIYILSSSINPNDIKKSKAYDLVAGFLHKPLEADEVDQIKANLGS